MGASFKRCCAGIAASAFAGCALLAPSVPPGASATEVEARFGKPTAIVTAPGGDAVWQYPKGPYGQQTYMVTFGADQRVKSFSQVLVWENLAKIRPGMTKDEIRLMFGYPTMEVVTYRNLNEEVWSYRYLIPVNTNRIFNVHFDASTGRVRTTSDMEDPQFMWPIRISG